MGMSSWAQQIINEHMISDAHQLELFVCSFLHDFERILDETIGNITCVSAGWVWSGLRKPVVQGRGANTAIPGTVPAVYSKANLRCVSRTYLSMLSSSITNAFHVDSNFQQSLVVKKPSKEEAAATLRKSTAQILNLGTALLASIYTSSKPISGALCFLCVSHECSPCKTLLYFIFLTLVVV